MKDFGKEELLFKREQAYYGERTFAYVKIS